jgi:hypothetical protein
MILNDSMFLFIILPYYNGLVQYCVSYDSSLLSYIYQHQSSDYICLKLTLSTVDNLPQPESTNIVVYFNETDGNLYLRLLAMSHTIYAA